MSKLKIDNFQTKVELPKLEDEVLKFWDEVDAFKKSIKLRPADKPYVFYDGPPFATGLPHYGHILASTIKDVIPRYWTMKGRRVERVWGWDCHGIPIENMIEKELGLKGGKKGIEELGVGKFNAACRAAILRFDKEWEQIVRRIGRWVDFKNSYKTMDQSYMESIWWAFKNLYDKGLVYEGRRVILYCPRCATPLSNFEIAMDNSYKEVEDNSVFVKFKAKGANNEYFVAWTTTPWTLIGNVALAVKPEAEYVRVAYRGEYLWIVSALVAQVLKSDEKRDVVETVKGVSLVGREYEPLYAYMPTGGKKSHYIAAADFVSLADGTGIVHTAAIYGEDDYKLALKLDLPCVPTLDEQGKFYDFVTPVAGEFYKKSEPWVIDDLTKRNLILRSEKTTHSYPFCYRCETPLYYNAVPAWFIDVAKMKPDLLAQNKNINWYPSHLKYGRFGKGLETAPDWNVSRSRYWGTPMPIWKEVRDSAFIVGGKMRIIGSLEELRKWAVDPAKAEKLTDIHREYLDDIEVWVDEAKTIKARRIPEVFDCWVESGSMPYAAIHYPFENKDVFEKNHPAQFIAEYIAQTRAWFYTLHVMSVGLFGKHTFENAVTSGTILAEDGTKMSKSKKNYPDPAILFEKYGVDALRFYLMESVVMKGENVNFSEKEVAEVYQKTVATIWNCLSFYKLYAPSVQLPDQAPVTTTALDRWIMSRLTTLVRDVTINLDEYDTVTSCREIKNFLTDLSGWYLRRSRERIKSDPNLAAVLGWVLFTLAKVMAPITPFISELVYQNLTNSTDSVHWKNWPLTDLGRIDEELEQKMRLARLVVENLLSIRKKAAIPVRQALGQYQVRGKAADTLNVNPELSEIIAEEVNVLSRLPTEAIDLTGKSGVSEVTVKSSEFTDFKIILDTNLTPQLKAMGEARELVRSVQGLRKIQALTVTAKITLNLPQKYQSLPVDLLEKIKRETLATSIVWKETDRPSIG